MVEIGEKVVSSHGVGLIKEALTDNKFLIKLLDGSGKIVTVGFEEITPAHFDDKEEDIPKIEIGQFPPNTKIPFNPAVIKGKFASGMSYYVLGNKEPPNRCELTVVIKTGSIHETEEELGIAHMLEHLTFRASKEIKKASNTQQSSTSTSSSKSSDFSLVRRLEESGIQFGAHQNAYTTFDETVYFLHVPMDEKKSEVENETSKDKSVHVLSEGDGLKDQDSYSKEMSAKLSSDSLLAECIEIISKLVLAARVTDEDVQAERAIVVEEWRSKQGVSQRWSDFYFEELLKGSRYAKRLPIGSLEVIRNVSGETMRRFYSERYHPSLMAVIAVGDFIGHETSVVELLRTHFENAVNAHWHEVANKDVGVMKSPSEPQNTEVANFNATELTKEVPPEPDRDIDNVFGAESTCLVLRDPEATYSQANVIWKKPLSEMGTFQSSRRDMLWQVTLDVMNNRLHRRSLEAQPQFSSAFLEDSNPVVCTSPTSTSSSEQVETMKGVRSLTLSVSAPEGELSAGIVNAWLEIRRAQVHGFCLKELELVQKSWQVSYQTAWLERNQEEAASLSDSLRDHFLMGVNAPVAAFDISLGNTMVSSFQLEELNMCIKDIIPCDLSHDVLVMIFQPTSKLYNKLHGIGLASLCSSADWVVGKLGLGLGAWLGQTESFHETYVCLNNDKNTGINNVELLKYHGISKGTDKASESELLNEMRECGSNDKVIDMDPMLDVFGGVDDAASVLASKDHPFGWPEDKEHNTWIPPGQSSGEGHGIVSTKQLGLNIYELELSNGVRVTYRYNDHLDDEILMKASAKGGFSEIMPRISGWSGDEQRNAVFSCSKAVRVATEFGIYGIPRHEVNDFLSTKRVGFSKSINYYDRRMSGDCSPLDLETQLRLVHVLFTAKINPDKERLATVMKTIRDSIINRRNDPLKQFDVALDLLTHGDHVFFSQPSENDVEKFDTDLALAFYLSNFNDPSEWRFVFSGNLNPTALKKLVVKYLASIPLSDRAWSITDTQSRSHNQNKNENETLSKLGEFDLKVSVSSLENISPLDVTFSETSQVKRLCINMQDPVSRIDVCWPLKLGSNTKGEPFVSTIEKEMAHLARLEESLLLDFACTILEQRLRDVLRLKMSAIYGVEVYVQFAASPPLKQTCPNDEMKGYLSVSFSCDPNTVLLLERVVFEEVAEMKLKGPTPSEVRTAVKTTRTSLEEHQRTNSYWVGAILSSYNSPRFQGEVAETLLQRTNLWKKLAVELEAVASPDELAFHQKQITSQLDGKSEDENKEEEANVSGSAGVLRMKKHFNKIFPPNTQHVVVTLQPAKPRPWKLIGVSVGVLSVTAVFLISKTKLLKR